MMNTHKRWSGASNMAQDKFTTPEFRRIARLRAARLTSKPMPEFAAIENPEPEVAISEKSPVTDTQRVEENPLQPSALSPTDISDKLSAVATSGSGKFRRARLSTPTKQEEEPASATSLSTGAEKVIDI